ncbi:trihelix transcription factor GT-3b-like [Ananas comosus]|uniref:Trihelix transcription factor GT-3b-like n=1 Tax=Ananas comosus TaxID=4615 RepID=A0A6P5EIX5_ANACO|nr:trihelix transcription factor GT-3b-like [Ananas comosus]
MNTSRARLRWGAAETRDLIAARAAAEAEEKCKCKWKSLVHPCNCKGKETSDADNVDEPATNMRRPHLAVESCASNPNKKLKRPSEDRSFDEFLEGEDEDEDEEENGNRDGPARSTKTRVARGAKLLIGDRSIVDVLRELMEWQQKAEKRWREEMERSVEERRVFEQEWRETVERLERERLMLERAMRESEEQARMREETRAEKRDALLNTLLDKLIPDGV